MKPLFFISCPIDCYAGYGARSRDFVKVLLDSNKYDIRILPQRWGNTPFGFLDKNNPEHKKILDCIWDKPTLPQQPDIWAQISVPNEFQPVGKFNLGVTAGIETTLCTPQFIEGLNRMDLTLVSSNHAKNVLEKTTYEHKDSRTNRVIKILKAEKPIEVLFEGVSLNVYDKIEWID